MVIVVKQRPFTRAAYHRLAETGVLAPDERVELIEGTTVAISPIGSFHGA